MAQRETRQLGISTLSITWMTPRGSSAVRSIEPPRVHTLLGGTPAFLRPTAATSYQRIRTEIQALMIDRPSVLRSMTAGGEPEGHGHSQGRLPEGLAKHADWAACRDGEPGKGYAAGSADGASAA
jgi:hypothetical protein